MQLSTITKLIVECNQNTGDRIVQAKSQINSIKTFEFINQSFWDSFLSKINRINLSLQEKNLDVVLGAEMIRGGGVYFLDYKYTREKVSPSLVHSSKITAGELGISTEFQ